MADPAPVIVTNPDPLEVKVTEVATSAADSTARVVAAKAGTDALVLSTEGQRAINRLWERTQSIIAISVVEVTLMVAAALIVAPLFKDHPDQTLVTASITGLVLLSNLVGNVTGFYFSRTNHTKVGGVSSASSGRGE